MSKDHKFWNTEPVGLGEGDCKIKEKPRENSLKLPKNYKIEHLKKDEIPELFILLKENYIGSADFDFTFEYSIEFLYWLFKRSKFCLVLKFEDKIVGFIQGSVHKLSVRKKLENFLGVDFLCLKIEHRNKNLAPCLISEITRLSTNDGIVSAIFTGSESFSFKFCTCRYFHLPISQKKLVDLEFLPDDCPGPEIKSAKDNFIFLNRNNLKQVYELSLKNKNYEIFEVESEDEFWESHCCVENAIYTFAQTDSENVVHGFFSFVVFKLNAQFDQQINTAFLFDWSVPNKDLFDGIASVCHKMGIDLVNCLEMGGLSNFLYESRFYPGTGLLSYCFYNFKTECVDEKDLKFVMM